MSAEQGRGVPDLASISKIAKETILDKGSHATTLIIVGDGRVGIFQIQFGNAKADVRQSLMKEIGEDVATHRGLGSLRKLFLISEGWFTKAGGLSKEFTAPSDEPNRKEVLFISMLDMETERSEMELLELLRDGRGQLTDLLEIDIGAPGGEVRAYLLEKFAEGYSSAM